MDYFKSTYDYYMSRGDERVKDWFGMEDPILTAWILVAYVVSIVGIRIIMNDRKPFELRAFIFIYNIGQVLASFYIFVEILIVSISSKYDLVCEPVNYSPTDKLALRMAKAMWLYYIMKLIDLIDTVLFALRKKSNQITFLHVFHHFSMVLNAWSGVKYVAGGQTFLLCMLNSFVHTIMYTYYGLSVLGPNVQKYLWWKKYLTQLQLVQFGIVMVHAIVNILDRDCPYPKGYSIAFVLYGSFITALFLNFYRRSYSSEKGAAANSKKPTTKKSD